MAIITLEGGIVTLDAHTTALLEAYTKEQNEWLTAALQGSECPYPPHKMSEDEMGRHLLSSFLHEWARQRRDSLSEGKQYAE